MMGKVGEGVPIGRGDNESVEDNMCGQTTRWAVQMGVP